MKNDMVEKIASVYANKLDIEDLPDAKGQKDGIDEIDAAFYWYYLADAQLKAEYYKDAIISAGKGMAILEKHPDYYPEMDKFKEIEPG